jgi:iron complex outermembrane receptor protein
MGNMLQYSKLRTGLLVGSSFIALVSAMPAAAQVTSPASALGSDAPAAPAGRSSTAASPKDNAEGDSSATLAEIVVHAQRRAERLEDAPITVNTATGEQLEQAGVTNIMQMSTVAPGVVINSNVGSPAAHIRGIGTESSGPTAESPVAIYVDGVYYAASQGSRLDFFDIDQIEILKGPQGTLFGRNATGGLIQITTKAPSHEASLDFDVGYGNYQTTTGDLYVTGGLSETIAASLALQAENQGEGWGKNLYDGKDVYRLTTDVTIRPKVLWTPATGTKVTLSADYSDNSNSFDAKRVLPGTSPALSTGGTNYGGSPWDTDANVDPYVRTQAGGASVTLEQDLPFARLLDIAAYRQTDAHIQFDDDSTTAPYESVDVAQREHQYSEELQLQSLPSSPVTWDGGLFYFNEAGSVEPADISLAGGRNIFVAARQDVVSVAGYGQATTTILPATNLTLGARLTYERHAINGGEALDIGGVPIAQLGDADAEQSVVRPTYRVSLDHHFSEEVMAFASFNTGFKSGGYQVYSPLSPSYAPETLKAYETGVKTELFGRKLRVDVSGFYYDYTNIQVQSLISNLPTLINGARAVSYGLDSDVQAQVTRDLGLHGALSYLHATFTSFPDAPISSPSGLFPVVSGSATGNSLSYSPKWALTFGGDYSFRNILDGTVAVAANYQYDSGFFLEIDNVVRQPAYSLVNASVKWTSNRRPFTVTIWGDNLTNVAVLTSVVTENFGTHNAYYSAPRTYGVKLGYHF